jgi:hypothetical protein
VPSRKADAPRVLRAGVKDIPYITETNTMHLVVFGVQNRTLRPYLAAINKILILLMMPGAAREPHCPGAESEQDDG